MEYKDCEIIALKALRYNKQRVTDENVGIVIKNILLANSRYKTDIGSKKGFINMYVNYAIKSIKSEANRMKRYIFVEDYSPFYKKLSYQDPNPFFWKDLEKYLTKLEYSVILSRYKNNMNLREIGEIEGISYEMVRQHIKRAISKLRESREFI